MLLPEGRYGTKADAALLARRHNAGLFSTKACSQREVRHVVNTAYHNSVTDVIHKVTTTKLEEISCEEMYRQCNKKRAAQ